MKSYILLRANKELGPYLFDELTSQPLYNKDLVWIEGESTSWRLASEIDELKNAVRQLPEEAISVPKKTAAGYAAMTTTDGGRKIAEPARFIPASVAPTEWDEPPYSSSDLRQELNQKKLLGKRKSAVGFHPDFLSLTVLLAGAMAGAFIIKQMVDNFDSEQPAIAEAKEIESVDIPASITSHSAQSITVLPAGEATQNTLQLRNDSLVRNIRITRAAPVVAHQLDSGNDKKVPRPEPTNAVTADNAATISSVKQSGTGGEEKGPTPEVARPRVGNNSIDITANNYKVGLLGGISGLELSVTNSSGETAENVVVEVEFLKPNGSVAKSEMVQAQNILPGTSKKVSVPSSSRGVKVRYHLVSTSAKEAAVPTDNM